MAECGIPQRLVAVGALAYGEVAAPALVAIAANYGERYDDPVADLQLLLGAAPDFDNLSHRFVT